MAQRCGVSVGAAPPGVGSWRPPSPGAAALTIATLAGSWRPPSPGAAALTIATLAGC
ncbi:hypothetical protein H7J83_14080 [Mycobacterium mantenii]|uniref:hypothetical protein n=1 Tax=Mycobacterium mantenii TaxID=560555 RepID=UPI001301AF28|nr:hypothetical protein [Mycobacterium mantenii]MCV7243851.1 hypothetical protein [Mycobacterium mantenii]